MKYGAIINFCSNEERFIGPCLTSLSKLPIEIVVSVSDHFFNGAPEDINKINEIANKYQFAKFIVYGAQNQYQPRPGIYSRKIAAEHLSAEVEWVLVLDADEIIDRDLFAKYLKEESFKDCDSVRLANFYYFRKPTYRAIQIEDSAVFVRRKFINFDPDNQMGDRQQVHEMIECRKRVCEFYEGIPMVHHYSWVRTKKEMLNKVSSWGHKQERDWNTLIEKEFSDEFSGKCFVHGYEYRTVPNTFNIDFPSENPESA